MMCPNSAFSPSESVRTWGERSEEQALRRKAAMTAARIGIAGRRLMFAEPFSSRRWLVSIGGGGEGPGMPGPLLFLVFLQQALKLPALVFVEQLLDARLAIAQYGAVILPKIVQNGLNLLGLRRRQVQ